MIPKFPEAQSQHERVAVFAGSFNPFTKGHLDILMRGLQMFDSVVVVRGVNCKKSVGGDLINQDLSTLIAGIDRAELIEWDGLTVDIARRVGAKYLLRGVRSVADFEYERNLADMNHKISGLETVLLLSRPELASISSSVVRELASYGHNVSEFLP